MRLDLFLKSSRLCLRRTVAQQLCDAGLVLVNGKVAKPATTVKAGDELSLRRRDLITTVRILELPSTRQTSRSGATSLYEITGEIRAVGEDGIDT
jgi:ribosomal 50S subunit-recycling heat shock protein